MSRMRAFFYKQLITKRQFTDDTLYKYALMMSVALYAGTAYVVYSFFFALAGCMPLAVIHVVGVVLYVLTCLWLEHGYFDFSGVVLCMMIVFSSTTTIYMVGGDNLTFFFLFLVLMILLVVPFGRRVIPRVGCVLMPFLMISFYLYGRRHVPPFDIGQYNDVLAVINIIVLFVGFTTMLTLNKFVRSFVDVYVKEQMDELQDQVYRDPLTGLHNRRFAETYFETLSAKDEEVSFVAIGDIDDFKIVNDTYGHDTGDKVLQEISAIMLNNTRKSDMVVRWGGEEFLLVIRDTNEEGAFRVLDKIRAMVEEYEFCADRYNLRVTMTMGMGLLESEDIENSIDQCDKKLYTGKRQGKNQVVL